MAQWVKLLAIKPDSLNLIPGSHNMQELTPNVYHGTHMHVPPHTQRHNQSINAPRHTHLVLRARRQRQALPWGCGAGKAPAQEAEPDCPALWSQSQLGSPQKPSELQNYLAPFEITSEPLLEQRRGSTLVTTLLPSFISKKLSVRHL